MSDNKNNETRKERYKGIGRSSMIIKLAAGLAGLVILALIFNFMFGESPDDDAQIAGISKSSETSMIQKKESSELDESMTESQAESELEKPSSEKVEVESKKTEKREKKQKEKEIQEQKELEKQKEKEIEKQKELEEKKQKELAKKEKEEKNEPIGTTQTGDHFTNYDDGSQDRIEIKEAVSKATGVPGDDMVENWVGNDGDQRVTSTITQSSTGKKFKVSLQWIDNKGWKVNQVEEQ